MPIVNEKKERKLEKETYFDVYEVLALAMSKNFSNFVRCDSDYMSKGVALFSAETIHASTYTNADAKRELTNMLTAIFSMSEANRKRKYEEGIDDQQILENSDRFKLMVISMIESFQ